MRSWLTPRLGGLAAGVVVASYFLYHARFSLGAEFTHDDLMNCHKAFFTPLSTVLGDIVLFFRQSDLHRPLPELVYRLAFGAWGFDLRPLRAILLLVIAGQVVLAYLFARYLTSSKEVGLLTALFSAYHPNLSAFFYFNTGTVYDVFSYLFYFAAFVFYARLRTQGRRLRPWHILLVCVLYGLALDSKEVAVSFPVTLAAYELFYFTPRLRSAALRDWMRRDLIAVWITAAMTAAYIPGRVMTQGGISNTSAYVVDVSWSVYLDRMGHFIGELFHHPDYLMPWQAAALALLLVSGAIWARSRALLVCLTLYFAGILPVAFIDPRGLTAVWIPTLGLLTYAAVAAVALRDAALNAVGRHSWRPAGQWVLFILAVGMLLRFHHDVRNHWDAWQTEYASIRGFHESMLGLSPTMPPGARMLFVTDPLNGTYSTLFAVQLLYRDSTSEVHQLFRFERKPSPAELERYDHVFDVVEDRLVRLDPSEYVRSVDASDVWSAAAPANDR